MRLGDVSIVGSMAWYDYSAAPSHLGRSVEQYAQLKGSHINDAVYVDWPWSDVELAALLRDGLERRLARLEKDPSVRAIVAVTHVPVFEEQILRKPGDSVWEFSNAYFGNLTTGSVIARYSKVRTAVAGHTHCGRKGVVQRVHGPAIEAITVGSEYGRPAVVAVAL